ncbi:MULTISPECIES: hypothetical protein [Enterobacter cloacae complex]|uniref:Uncharacterized protein n=1 Tax=Enterobacter hormaechei TaxID=158836 RepID=A0A9X7KYJ4_9ENTR|nr:hypothetical protein [Enterobacter hormaechei]HAS1743170.1 hypothetical protein [Enterobacter hormaechei subsp. oharae]HAV1627420.1 hypothetical protein [Enterobacter hormaechei subsp. steigerwaltii]KTH05402.1 hypothetical protein ASV34_21730 [Enterobacter hormaechei subsp. xiangfangensis]KTH12674.1 hypothetical protein ASV33_21625 [Enterobacter hormaechei subsp. xiangfangensis]KTI14212.1 hypothetical protein ASV12_06165 [Enterobacter hormaechei subsp. xiangfangensis]
MADFRKSLSVGVAAAVAAAENKKEIQDLINEVNSQIEETYEGKVHFGVWTLKKSTPKKQTKGNIFFGALNFDFLEYDALCITNHEDKEPIDLVEWKVGDAGYPCILKYEEREAYCYNREDLITELSTLLSDVKTGEAILKQLNKFNKEEIGE